jgi:hydroxymethylpyrimidine pyrophosphatase-like HAD family hydrolase
VHWVDVLTKRFGDRLFIAQSLPTFLEIADPSVGKGSAVAHLAATLGIRPEEIVAVGDGMNDLDMIEMAGCGVAMGNARDGLKQAAKRVTKPYDQDGVACLIEDLIAEGSL